MKGLLIVALCTVYSVQAWNQKIGPLHIETKTGTVPHKYYPLTRDDKRATSKGRAFVGHFKNVHHINPLKLTSLGPYNVDLPNVNFQGDLRLSNIVVKGLKSLTLSSLEMRMNPSRIDFKVKLPQVSSDADFELRGVLNSCSALLRNQTLNVSGQLSLSHSNFAVWATVGTKLAQSGSKQVYEVDSADIHIDLSKLQLSMNMNQYAEESKEIVVQFLENTPKYSSIMNDLLRAILQAVNRELTHITSKDILQFLLG